MFGVGNRNDDVSHDPNLSLHPGLWPYLLSGNVSSVHQDCDAAATDR